MERIVKKNRGSQRPLKVVELFSGVGGFRIGFEGKPNKKSPWSHDWSPQLAKGSPLQITWSNQWEPATKVQHAASVYRERFHNGKEPNQYFNADINLVVDMNPLPIPKHDLLVGGFPCQDYSVARTLSQAAGIEGKKGVLWWAIHKILKRSKKDAPNYILLENVDRLLKSPAKQRGRDFGIILASLSELGYVVEWRVVNAADYGMPQRRRRTFILGYKKNSPIGRLAMATPRLEWITKTGVIAKAFPVIHKDKRLPFQEKISGSLLDISEKFKFAFENTGMMVNGEFISLRTHPNYDGPAITLKNILLPPTKIREEYWINEKNLSQWKYLKGAKKDERTAKNGFSYVYNEGPMNFPDPLDRPSRTIVTGEGGPTPSRFKHVVMQNGKYRRLTPVELERLCMFPDDHTEHQDISDVKRAFFMGNALVVGVINKLGNSLYAMHRKSSFHKRPS
ncbi:MAG: Cytosine-specific methyltransferase [Parcubacteria group bacterium GW2011_GWA1_50_14]|uniref:Cytosine-specific methyltransferase n=1 Tax=Candidatus Liptonbacteria bacterium GWB1_49_6 TaxID=1798644 RepID=A0A1G2C7D2_9BACT|nr:MAG: Cytosine-specific methyltransferase [Parcubacteria group bacterium GW2011_GWA1_50_14]OGY97304.1 MAG: hypothetical protein A2122_01915 [Candidatus Liptonbacteria bacterium GWB1_49_6]